MFDVGNDERIIAEQAWKHGRAGHRGPDPVKPPTNQSHRRLTTIEIIPRVRLILPEDRKFQQIQIQIQIQVSR
jgi:hypothetical protein